MFIGVCQITLHIPASHSLKDKRQVVRSVLARLRNQFEVSAAEVATQDTWQLATIGLALASGDAAHTRHVLERASRAVEEWRPDVAMTDVWIDVLTIEP